MTDNRLLNFRRAYGDFGVFVLRQFWEVDPLELGRADIHVPQRVVDYVEYATRFLANRDEANIERRIRESLKQQYCNDGVKMTFLVTRLARYMPIEQEPDTVPDPLPETFAEVEEYYQPTNKKFLVAVQMSYHHATDVLFSHEPVSISDCEKAIKVNLQNRLILLLRKLGRTIETRTVPCEEHSGLLKETIAMIEELQ